jgi:cardiolipin synthase
VLRDGTQTLPAMFAAMREARRHIHLEYYVIEDIRCGGGALLEVLGERRQAGVQIAIIYDALGCSGTDADFFRELHRRGVRLLQFNPVNPLAARGSYSPNRRDHRKMLIVDGLLAIVGGVNMSCAYEAGARRTAARAGGAAAARRRQWRDTDLRLQGPAVAQLQRLFLEHWRQGSEQTLKDVGFFPPTGQPGHELVGILGSSPAARAPRYYEALLRALRTARRRIWITAGYFLPTPAEMRSLVQAARRQVDVRLLLPSHNDSVAALAVQRCAYQGLLDAGVQIFERNEVILHSKSIVVDQSWSVVGSSNLDYRSVLFNDEVDAVVIGTRTANELSQLFLEDLAQSQAIVAAQWRQRPLRQKLLEAFWWVWRWLL